MSTHQIQNRVRRIEAEVRPKDDGTYTLEELARSLWKRDRQRYLEMAKGDSVLHHFQSQFEREDAKGPATG